MSENKPLDPLAEVELHLIRAGRELLAAARGVIDGLDAALEVMEERVATRGNPPVTVEAIPIRRNTS